MIKNNVRLALTAIYGENIKAMDWLSKADGAVATIMRIFKQVKDRFELVISEIKESIESEDGSE